jgi:MGT family glycosyltransferase
MPAAAEMVDLLRDGNMVKVTRMLFQASEHLIPFLLDELRREQPDVFVHDSIALWGSICARLLKLPSIASITHFIFEGVDVHRKPLEVLHILWDALPLMSGILQSRRRLARRYGGDIFQKEHLLPVLGNLNIMYTAEGLQPRSTLIDHTFRFVGPSINQQMRQDDDFPYAQLDRRPLIYISLGTIHYTHTEFFRTAFDAFRHHPGQFVLSVGDQAEIGPIPANFIVRPHVPQLEILKRADVFVTHGGMNSVHEGLYYGVPLVLVPHQMEQLFNARVVESHGAGVLLGNVSADTLRQRVHEVLQNPAYRAHAREIEETLTRTGGYRQAADEIEAFALQNSKTHLTQSP